MPATRASVFLSYKRGDGDFVSGLAAAIEAEAVRRGLPADVWWDASRTPGEDWDDRIRQRMQSAQVIVAIASPAFFDSEYISKFEVPLMLQRWNRGQVTQDDRFASVIPVLYRDVQVDTCPLRQMQFFRAELAFADLVSESREDVLAALVDLICDALAAHHDVQQAPVAASVARAYVAAVDGVRLQISADPDVSPEDQLKPVVSNMITALAGTLGIAGITTTTEQRVQGARLDIAVRRNGLIVGMIELKAPGKSADPDRQHGWSAHDKKQWKVLADHPNLIYCNGAEWALRRHGWPKALHHVNLDDHVQSGAVAEAATETLLGLVGDFLRWDLPVPSAPKLLAARLAPLTRLLRDDVLQDIARDGNLAKLHQEWQRTILPGSSEQDFADAYAQTFTYALLLARLEGAASPLRAGIEAQATLRAHGQSVLAAVLKVLGQDAAREALDPSVSLLERTLDGVDRVRFERSGEQWLFFYEFFLQQYDPQTRNARGVFYTPLEIVRCQARLVQHVLRDRMGTGGFADPAVRTLDPATGTGSYPLAVIAEGLRDAPSRREAAERLAENVYGFELLVGAYAVAHLRVTQALTAEHVDLGQRGAQIILTDTLSEPADNPHQPSLFAEPLAEEQARASNVKAPATRITVVLGNPPYNRAGGTEAESDTGGIVRFPFNNGDPALLADFIRPLTDAGLGASAKNLYNDYVYFWRWAIWKACQQDKDEPAVVSFITANSFLGGPGFAGMRRVMREQFDELWIVDLGGEGRGALKEANEFDILTPVCVTVAFRFARQKGARHTRGRPATVRYQKITGDRPAKIAAVEALRELDPDSPGWQTTSADWLASFLPDTSGAVVAWMPLADLFPWAGRGVQFSRAWPVSESKTTLTDRWDTLLRSGDNMGDLLHTTRDVTTDGTPASCHTGKRLPALQSLAPGTPPEVVERIWWRSFDTQWCIADRRVVDMPRPPLWRTLSDQQMFLTTLQQAGPGPAMIASPHVPDLNAYNNRGGTVIPLFRDKAGQQPNLTPGLLDALTAQYGRDVSAEDVAAYAVGVLGTRAFMDAYGDQIGNDLPRVPVTGDPTLFTETVELGTRLIRASTHHARLPEVNKYGTPTAQAPGSAREIKPVPPDVLPSTVRYDSTAQLLHVGDGEFGPVTPAQWASPACPSSHPGSATGSKTARAAPTPGSPRGDLAAGTRPGTCSGCSPPSRSWSTPIARALTC